MKKVIKIILVLSLLLFTFSSCDKDEFEWREAELGYKSTIPIPKTGVINNHTFTLVGYEWVNVTSGGRYDYIDDINYRIGDILIPAGTYIDYLTFDLEGSDAGFDYKIYSNKGVTIKDTDPDIRYFYNEIVEMIRRTGRATVIIGGRAEPSRDVVLDLLFTVNVKVWY